MGISGQLEINKIKLRLGELVTSQRQIQQLMTGFKIMKTKIEKYVDENRNDLWYARILRDLQTFVSSLGKC